MNAPDHIGNAISEYSITKRDKIPGIPDVKAAYDKLSVVMICLNPRTGKGNRLTQMLNILLSSEIKPERKIRKLEEDESVIRSMVEKIQKKEKGKIEDEQI